MTYMNNSKYNIYWSKSFEYDLDKIFNYLFFNLNEPSIARKLYKKILTSLYSLEYFPEKYLKLTNISNSKYTNLHRLIISNYIIIYEIKHDIGQIFVLHIFHCSQNYLNLL